MKKLLLIFIIFLLLLSFTIGGIVSLIIKKSSAAKPKEEIHLPQLKLKTLAEETIKFDKIRKPSLLLFWLPQSKSCLLQLDILSKIQAASTTDIQIMAIGIGNLNAKELKKIIEEKNISYPILIDNKVELTKKLKITTIPTLVFYHPHKEPISIVGLQEKKELNPLINNYLLKNE